MNMEWILKCFPDYHILVEYDHIENADHKQEVHGLKTREHMRCMFCGKPFEKWKKKDIAHAVSECAGNKRLISYCECYECNHLFGEIAENHLGKFLMPYRIINEVYGKGAYKNVVKDMPVEEDISYRTYRYEQRKYAPIFPSEIFDVRNMLIEKAGTGKCTMTKDGFCLSIPRQRYQPQLAYASLLKIAYALLPSEEFMCYMREALCLYLCLSKSPCYCYDENGIETVVELDENEKQAYINSLPNTGIEIRIANERVSDGVNVCLLKRRDAPAVEPQIMFALQMKWHTIVIPIFGDDCMSGDSFRYRFVENNEITYRQLNFHETEDEFICDMSARRYEIPKELYAGLEEDLRNSGLLKKTGE